MAKHKKSITAKVRLKPFENLIVFGLGDDMDTWNVTNVFSVMEKAGFAQKLKDGDAIEIAFRIIAGPAEPADFTKEK